ncbi:hypothetical protein SAMN05444285_111112 [Draconibacterium orientale]|uniref:Uncharacterized protein n=1 Tax=Draconibacterium orientale TaxID=1168034 RepID=A0A1I0DXD4_9BACT|nr:hypothetical protein [Draconibacterium orientale]SET37183.1 hypothetical protein SAMN05444285_111112 [Draconibacterium orientale]
MKNGLLIEMEDSDFSKNDETTISHQFCNQENEPNKARQALKYFLGILNT